MAFPTFSLQEPKGVCVHQNAEYQVSSELGGDREDGGTVCLLTMEYAWVMVCAAPLLTSACSCSLDLRCIPPSARTVYAPTPWTTTLRSTSSPVPMCPATSPAAP